MTIQIKATKECFSFSADYYAVQGDRVYVYE